jgi:hypothetical protein
MKRRESLKALALSTFSATVLLQSCDIAEKEVKEITPDTSSLDRQPVEKEREERLMSEQFFNKHEMKTIRVLCDIIIPSDEVSGSATEAGVPEFIEFIVKDIPRHQIPMRGGLKWIDIESLKQFGGNFIDLTSTDQLKLIDQIAYPENALPSMKHGVRFFNLMRDLTATGFFTSKMGIQDLGYVGNKPNRWDGVPQEVLDQYGLKYDQKTLDESVKWDHV